MENITVENANELLAKAKISDTNYRQQAAAWVIINQFCYQSGLYHKRDEDHLSGIQKVIKYLSETQSENKALQRELDNEIKIREEYFEDAQLLLEDKRRLKSENKALQDQNKLLNSQVIKDFIAQNKITEIESENKSLREEVERVKDNEVKFYKCEYCGYEKDFKIDV